MKIKIFNGYSYSNTYKLSFEKVENEINKFIKDKNVIDIKMSGSQCDYGFEMFQYVVVYEEEK